MRGRERTCKMADEPQATPAPENGAEEAPAASRRRGLVSWIILAGAVVLIGSASGWLLSRLLAQSPQVAQAQSSETAQEPPQTAEKPPSGKDERFKYLDFPPILANLDEPRLGRHVRATITLAISESEFDQASKLIESRKPELTNCLMVLFSACTLDEVRGAKNLNRLRREILEKFNEQLWPDRRSPVRQVLFKEFSVQ